MGSWQFQTTLPVMIVIVVAISATAWLSLRHLRDSHLGWRTRLMEALRILTVLLICVTLMRPERVTKLTRERKPELVILLDDTASMQTVDVPTGDGTVESRRDWLERLQAEKPWAELEAIYDVTVEGIADAAAETGGSDLQGALKRVQASYQRLRAVLLISDGAWNTGGSPVSAATQLRLQGSPVYTVAVGSDTYLPDLALEDVKAPAFGLINERISIPFHLRNHMDHDVRVPVSLNDNGLELARKELVVPAGGSVHNAIIWTATSLGERTLSLSIPTEPEEVDLANNSQEFRIAIRRETLRVLVVESQPRWEFRYLRNALMRDPGVQVDCLLLHPQIGVASGQTYIPSFPATRDAISVYDVIFLGDVGVGQGELTLEQLEMVKGLVGEQGSGLVVLPGLRGRSLSLADSPIGEMMPVTLDATHSTGYTFPKESRLTLTEHGEDHLLTLLAGNAAANRALWRNLPGFFWNAPVVKARPGSDVLAVHETYRNDYGRLPLLVTRPYGAGNVLFMGTDSAWRWRKGVEDTYHYRFWGQVVRWMAHPRHLAHDQRVRLVYSPENPRRGDKVFMRATVFDAGGFPIRDGEVQATLRGPNQRVERLNLTPTQGDWGVFIGSFEPEAAGTWSISVDSPGRGRLLDTELQVGDRVVEAIGQPAHSNVLREIAGLSNGRFATNQELSQIITQLRDLPESDDLQLRFSLWSQWWWGLGIFLLMALLWTLRKYWGLV